MLDFFPVVAERFVEKDGTLAQNALIENVFLLCGAFADDDINQVAARTVMILVHRSPMITQMYKVFEV